ncbi:lysine 2,3-aminomutase [hydrocarbon metagenome]|uniref:Lysine 2,3-aminomutase n=1 Tax=hydrocarbon metagenome TaxID=938273 RepID=A0A0W8FS26_9ZZZZ
MERKTILTYFKASAKDWRDWHWQFRNRVTKLKTLENLFGKAALHKDQFKAVTSVYPMAITPYYLSLFKTYNDNDPIQTQCVPDIRELSFAKNAMEDPLEEDSHMPVPKLVYRYSDRCLAIVTETCVTYCRHCNRKRFWSQSNHFSLINRLQKMTRYLAKSPHIREVIISGGDPLTFDDNTLEKILSSLKAIPHIEILRIGSRTPVVMPMRITKELCRTLKRYRPLWFNTQFNHPNEITTESARACQILLEAGIPVSNQSVLLKGVNDSAQVMKNLFYGLQKISVRPYYLFHCDPVKGCIHFRTDPQAGVTMMEKIWKQSSGLCLPQYVMDVPGSAGKIPLNVMSKTINNDLKKNKHFFDKFK